MEAERHAIAVSIHNRMVEMSTGLECEHFTDPETGKWYYVLQNWDSPAQAWDWREYATCYGPFDSNDDAYNHRRKNHANPGHWSIQDFTKGDTWFDSVYQRLIIEAESPKKKRDGYIRPRYI